MVLISEALKSNLVMKKKNIIQGLLLSLILIVFPAMSWYYLSTGFDYQLDSRAEMKDYGTNPNYSLLDQRDEMTTLPAKGSAVVVSNIFAPNVNETNDAMQWLHRVHGQFDNRLDVTFRSLVSLDTTMTSRTFAKQNQIKDGEQWKVLNTNAGELMQIRQALNIPDSIQILEQNLIWVADTSHTIRRFYDASQLKEMERLIEHISYLMPIRENNRKE